MATGMHGPNPSREKDISSKSETTQQAKQFNTTYTLSTRNIYPINLHSGTRLK